MKNDLPQVGQITFMLSTVAQYCLEQSLSHVPGVHIQGLYALHEEPNAHDQLLYNYV